jgi:hypothetical protein
MTKARYGPHAASTKQAAATTHWASTGFSFTFGAKVGGQV